MFERRNQNTIISKTEQLNEVKSNFIGYQVV